MLLILLFGPILLASWLIKWVSFLASLRWPAGGSDLGVGGIS